MLKQSMSSSLPARLLHGLFIVLFGIDVALGQGGDEEIKNLRDELISCQALISDAFESFEKSPESVLEKGSGLFAAVPSKVQTIKEKLANQRTIFRQRVEKRKSDTLISEDRRKKSIQLYQEKLNEVSRLDDGCKELIVKVQEFLSKDIPRLKNEYDIDCEDFGKEEAKMNLTANLDKIADGFKKSFAQFGTQEGEKKN
jgi:hypothetical protein